MYFAFTDEEKQCTHSSCLKGVLLAKVPGSQIRHFFCMCFNSVLGRSGQVKELCVANGQTVSSFTTPP